MASLEEIKKIRLKKKKILKDNNLNSYPSKVVFNQNLKGIIDNFQEGQEVNLVGRIVSLRSQGVLIFFDLFDGTGTLQGLLKKDEVEESCFDLFVETIDIGDFISVEGKLFTTHRGQPTVALSNWKIITKSLRPLPEKWYGLKDPEERYRKRYLDLLMNPEIKEIFVKKAQFWDVVRKFFKERDFLEVETPMLEITTGGAEARPFITHHNDFDIDLYLRISVGELWHKRLLISGFTKTFEIGRIFRNEGTSAEHLQEFTNLEFYWAYANYQDGMKLSQELYRQIAKDVFGTTKFESKQYQFDLADEWKEVDFQEEILKQTGIDILSASESQMKSKLDKLGVKYEGENRERLIDTLWKYCREKISGPVFLVNHPKLVAPLAKAKEDHPELTERFQIIIAGSEIGNGFSELNDPLEQKARFEAQQVLLKKGDVEAMMPDWDFTEALEYGMPPACGFGFGERLFWVLAGVSAREGTLFPLMRPRE